MSQRAANSIEMQSAPLGIDGGDAAARADALWSELKRLEAEVARIRSRLQSEQVAPPPEPPLTMKEALGVAEALFGRPISYSSLRRWCLEFDIGKQTPAGAWMIDAAKLRAFAGIPTREKNGEFGK